MSATDKTFWCPDCEAGEHARCDRSPQTFAFAGPIPRGARVVDEHGNVTCECSICAAPSPGTREGAGS